MLLAALAVEPRPELVLACARLESELGRHADARRRLLAARAAAPPEHQPALAFELAAHAFQQGRTRQLHGWAEPAMRAAAHTGDAKRLAAAEALAALGALWLGEPADDLLDRAGSRFDALPDDRIAGVAAYVAVSQLHHERFDAATATATRGLKLEPEDMLLLMTRALARLNRADLD